MKVFLFFAFALCVSPLLRLFRHSKVCLLTYYVTDVILITIIILLPEKFLQFDWLRADVFQLNLKYLHVKITVTMVTPNHHIISSHELRKNGEKISRF